MLGFFGLFNLLTYTPSLKFRSTVRDWYTHAQTGVRMNCNGVVGDVCGKVACLVS